MNLNYIVTSKTLKEATLPPGKSFNTLMIIKTDAGKAGEVEIYTSARGAIEAGITGDLLTHITKIFAQELAPAFVKVGYVSAPTPADLTALSIKEDWYLTLFLDDEVTEGDIPALSDWLSAEKKLGIITDTNAGALDASAGISKALFDAKADHFFAIYAPKVDEDGNPTDEYRFISSVIAGAMATVDFDDRNSYYALPHLIRNYNGVSPVNMTPTQRQALTGYEICVGYDKDKGLLGNYYGTYEGYHFLYSGLMPNGVGINQVHFIDWLNRRIQESQAIYFKNNKVTTYRDEDLAGLLLNFKQALIRGVRSGGLVEEQIKTITLEDLKEQITDTMRSNHLLPTIQAEIKCSGWISHTCYESVCVPFAKDLTA